MNISGVEDSSFGKNSSINAFKSIIPRDSLSSFFFIMFTLELNGWNAKNKAQLAWTYYSTSLTKSKPFKTSWSLSVLIKLLPSGSKLLNTLRACSLLVSGLTRRLSSLNNTGYHIIKISNKLKPSKYLLSEYRNQPPTLDV